MSMVKKRFERSEKVQQRKEKVQKIVGVMDIKREKTMMGTSTQSMYFKINSMRE